MVSTAQAAAARAFINPNQRPISAATPPTSTTIPSPLPQHVLRKTLRPDTAPPRRKPPADSKIIPLEDRKRYEGIFAANKGVYTTPDRISRIIVQELWSRSKLDSETLRKIWDLVTEESEESNEDGLTCEQFVAGIWLIDQCLQGRKLPKCLPDSIWDTTIDITKPRKNVFRII